MEDFHVPPHIIGDSPVLKAIVGDFVKINQI